MADSLEQLLQEELAVPEAEWENGHRQVQRLLSPPSIEGATTLQDEPHCLMAHWGPIFGSAADIDELAWLPFERHVQTLPWPLVRCDMAEIASLLARLQHTAAGPDGITNAMLGSAPRYVAPLLQEAMLDIMNEGPTPSSWHDAQLVLIPKEEAPALHASEFRPLALGNTLGKVISRYLLFQLQAVFPKLHPAQRGFMPDQSIALAIGRLEQYAHTAASLSTSSCLLLCLWINCSQVDCTLSDSQWRATSAHGFLS
eukprot:4158359-Amphidinium_carterae.1